MPEKKPTPKKKPPEKKVARKPKKSRAEYGASKMRAAEEILDHAKTLVELRAAGPKFPGLKGVFDKEVTRRKAAIKSRLERA